MSFKAKAQSEFIKNVFTLVTGTAIAQCVPVILSPFLRRWITIEEYAVFEVFFRLISIISIAAALRYPLAIVLPKEDKEASNLLCLSILISTFINLLLLGVIYFFNNAITLTLNIPDNYSSVLYWVPVGAFLISMCNIFNYWLIRKKAFSASSINKVVHKVSESTFWVSFIHIGFQNTLIWGDLLARLAWLLMAIKQSINNQLSVRYCSLKEMWFRAIEYKAYPLYNTLPALLNVASLMLPVIFVNKLYDESVTSNLGLCMQVLGFPLALISMSVSQVLFQKITESKNKSISIKSFISNLVFKLVLMGALGIVIMYFFGEYLFVLVYGEFYRDAGTFASILVFSIALKFVISPLSLIFPALDNIKMSSLWQCIYFIMILLLLFLPDLSILDFLLAYLAIEILAYTLHAFMIYRVISNYEHKLP